MLKTCEKPELSALAASPELIESREQFIALTEHIKSCADCANRFSSALAARSIYIEPLRKEWKHLSKQQLRSIHQQSYLLGSSNGEDTQLFHLDLCAKCRASYLSLSQSARVRFKLAGAIVGIGVMLAAFIMWVRAPERRPERVYRSEQLIELKDPADDATIGINQDFSWEPDASVQIYRITINDAATHKEVLTRDVAQSAYVLVPGDADHLVDGGVYEWSISAKAGGLLHSRLRRFRFVAMKGAQYQDFVGNSREKIHDQIVHSDTTKLGSVEERLKQYIGRVQDKELPDTAWVHGELAIIEYRRNEAGSGEHNFQAALAMWRRLGIPDLLSYNRTLSNYALSLQDNGRLAEALQVYKQACETPEVSLDRALRQTRSSCLLDLGSAYHDLGMPREAGDSYRKALQIDRELQLTGAVAEELNNLGNLETDDFANPKQGLAYLQEAMTLQNEVLQKTGHPQSSFPDTLDATGGAYAALDNSQEAIRYYQSALHYDEIVHSLPTRRVQTLNNLGNIYLVGNNDIVSARAAYKQALQILVAQGSNVGPDQAWRIYDGLGRVALKNSEYAEARKDFSESLKLIHELTQQTGMPSGGIPFSSLLTSPFYGLTLLECRQGSATVALQTMENARALPATALDLEKVGVDALHKAIGSRTAVLEYLAGGKFDPVLLVTVGSTGTHCYELGIRKDIDLEVSEVSTSGSVPSSGNSAFTSLRRFLIPSEIQTAIEDHSIDRLLVSLDGSLTQIPFSALKACESCSQVIGDVLDMSNIPSITWLFNIQSQTPLPHTADALVIGDPIANPIGCASVEKQSEKSTFTMLPAAHKEITTVSSYAAQGTVILENSDLNRHTFDHSWKRVGDFRLVHFATHAVNRGSQHNSFILLRCDRALEAVYGDEIARDHMQANLIVLSTCNSASGEVLSAHGVDSVAMAFLSAGNRCVIASRSDVQDNDVASFVGSLYRSLALGRTPEEAVRSAQKGLRSASHGNAVFESYGACNIAVPIHPRTLTTVFLIKERWIGVLIAIAVLGSVIGVLYRRRYLRRRYQAAVNP